MNKVVELDTFDESLNALNVTDQGHAFNLIRKLRSGSGENSVLLKHLEGINNPNIWYGRVTREMRVIIWREQDAYYLLHIGRHDPSIEWVKRRKIKRHSVTGALQMVIGTEVLERYHEEIPPLPAPPLLASHTEADLLSLGVPEDWLLPLRQLTNIEAFLDMLVTAEMPEDVQDRLMDLLDGKRVAPAPVIAPDQPPELYPTTRHRFMVLAGEDEDLERLFLAPRPLWMKYLHPTQSFLVTAPFRGPAKVSGSAGTGKTVVAMHRARHLARQGKRVLLTTFVRTLPPEIEENLRLLCTTEEMARITVKHIHSIAATFLARAGENWTVLDDKAWLQQVAASVRATSCTLDGLNLRTSDVPAFVAAELDAVIEAQNTSTWDEYRMALRRGRGIPLTVVSRKKVWDAVAHLRAWSEAQRKTTYSGLCTRATTLLCDGSIRSSFDAVIVDEVQDLGPQELRLVAAIAGDDSDAIMVVGDPGQRLYRRPVSLRACGIETRGRSHILRVNYRTTHQIRGFADAMLGEVQDEDDARAGNRRTRSVVRGPEPVLRGFATESEQDIAVVEAIRTLTEPGDGSDAMPYSEIAVFAPTNSRVDRIYGRLVAAGIPARRLHDTDRKDGTARVSVGTMHRAKGLEYRAVLAVDVAEGIINEPPQETENPDPRDRADIERRQRHLLYVSLTRARNELHVYWVGEPCMYLLDAMTAPTAV